MTVGDLRREIAALPDDAQIYLFMDSGPDGVTGILGPVRADNARTRLEIHIDVVPDEDVGDYTDDDDGE